MSLIVEDHSKGTAHVTHDMLEFQECMNEIEVEDVCSSGFQYTWTKNLLKPNATGLNKIDKVMCNTVFLSKHSNANVVFLPYGISDHSTAILNFPGILKKQKRSFRFSNYVVDKEEFKSTISDKWNIPIEGNSFYKLVSKQKAIKPHLNNLNWKNGNLFVKVAELKEKLHEI